MYAMHWFPCCGSFTVHIRARLDIFIIATAGTVVLISPPKHLLSQFLGEVNLHCWA